MAGIDPDGAAEVRIETGVEPDDAPVVILSGELDSTNVDSLEAIVASITAQRSARIFFDLAQLRFMDSAGIAVLLTAAKVSDVHVRNPSAIVRRVLEATGLSGVLSIEP